MAASSESPKLQALAKVGLNCVAIALVLTLLGGWIVASRPVAAIDEGKLQKYQDSLRSYINESLLLAQQYQHQRTLANFTTVSANKLHTAVSDLASQLETERPEPAVKAAAQTTADQANQLADTLADFSKAADQGRSANFVDQLQALQHEASQ